MRCSRVFMIFRKMFFILVLSVCFTASASERLLKTPVEEGQYTQYSRYEDIVRFLSEVSALSKSISVQVVGRTLPKDDFPSQNILLCILTREGAAYPSALNREKPTLFLTASKHGNEQSAREAVLGFIRDLALGDLQGLLDRCNFLVIPQVNPYGNAFDRRENEIGLDMNRDHAKLETEGVRAVHLVFREWMPEITLDVHERGDNFYRVALGCVSNANIDMSLQKFSRRHILSSVEKKLVQEGITFHEYLVEEEMGLNTAAGAALGPEDTAGREMLMRYSTSDINDGRNGPGMYQTLSFIQEVSSQHDLKTLQERTCWQSVGLRTFAGVMADRSQEILTLVRSLRTNLAEKTKTYSGDNLVHLKMEYARDEANPTLTIQEFRRTDSLATGIMKVTRKEGDTLLESDFTECPYPANQEVVTHVISNWFSKVIPTMSVVMPLGYVIPAKHFDVVETLLRHGMEVSLFRQDCETGVEAYQVTDVVPSKHDYLPPDTIDVVGKRIKILIKQGDFYVACAQPAARLIPCFLEPQSDYGLIRYRKFRLVPEKGEFFAFYRVFLDQKMPLVSYHPW